MATIDGAISSALLSVVLPVPLGGVEIITGCCGNGGGGCCNNNDQFIMDTLTTMRTDVNGIATEIANLGSQLSQGQCRTPR